uniref:Uncharacterized protein n=1 Tax=Caenorhabditis japonica TaxID=281687 RepID=A0A8R1E8X4_CAEJA
MYAVLNVFVINYRLLAYYHQAHSALNLWEFVLIITKLGRHLAAYICPIRAENSLKISFAKCFIISSCVAA